MDICIIFVNIAAIVVIFLIAVYLWLDKKRFHVERQFRAVEELFDEWMTLAAEAAPCSEAVVTYRKTKNISEKYRAIDVASRAAWGYETPAMQEIAEELHVFLGVYRALAENYNRKLNSKFTGRIARFLGFRKFPDIKLETEHV